MQDASSYCAHLVREADRDRFLAALFAPAESRAALFALYAFNIEVARVREAAREAIAGEIRLRWWSDVINGERDGEARANPVAAALVGVMERHRFVVPALLDLVEARRFDLYDEPMHDLPSLEAYAGKTSSTLIAVAAQLLAGVETDAIAASAGVAYAVAGLLRAFPLHAARRQLYVPVELLKQHGVQTQDIFADRSSRGLEAAFAELRNVARRHLLAARERIAALPRQALPAFLPVALVRPRLDRLERCDPFAPNDLPAWRRQWLIWRAARNPARIAA